MTISARVVETLKTRMTGASVGSLGEQLRERFDAVLESCLECSELIVSDDDGKAGAARVELAERARCPSCLLPLAIDSERLNGECVQCFGRFRCFVVAWDVQDNCWSVYSGWNDDPDKPLAQCFCFLINGAFCQGRRCVDISKLRGGGCLEIWASDYQLSETLLRFVP